MNFEEYFSKTDFEIELVKAVIPIMANHFKEAVTNEGIKYGDIGNENEKHLVRIQEHHVNLRTVIKDLDLVKEFLSIKDRKQIMRSFPNLESKQEYYKYHFENYMIRLVTLSDIIGKMGNEIFQTGIDPKDCNGYRFKREIKPNNPKIAQIVEKLLVRIKEIKDKRHQKIHQGQTDIDQLDKIVFWDELDEILNSKNNPILEQHTDEALKEEINKLDKEVKEIIDIIKEFLDEAKAKILEISGR